MDTAEPYCGRKIQRALPELLGHDKGAGSGPQLLCRSGEGKNGDPVRGIQEVKISLLPLGALSVHLAEVEYPAGSDELSVYFFPLHGSTIALFYLTCKRRCIHLIGR